MLKLSSARILQAVMGGAITTTAPSCVVGFSDKAVGGAGYDGDAKLTDLNGTTAVTVCAAPASSTNRHIDYLTLRNNDSVQQVFTVRYNESSVLTTLIMATLGAGEMLGFTHSSGWYVNTADGSRKSGAVQDLSGYQLTSAKDASGGYVGLTGFAINFKNVLGTVVSLFTNGATAIRTYAFPDKSGTVAMTSDVITDHTALSNIGTNTHAQIDTHIASTANPHSVTKAQVGLGSVDDTSDANKPVSTAQAASDASVLSTAEAYADSLVTAILDDRGSFDASGNVFPSTGGRGAAGAILKGDLWTISVAGTLGGQAVDIGDVVRALANAPGQTAGNWTITEHNFGYVAENSANKNASGGYAGLTLFKLNLLNALGTITSFFTTAATVARTWTMPDKSGTVAMTSDITGTNSGTNTGDQTITLTGDATGSGTGTFTVTVAKINGVSLGGLATGILKNTTTTGVPSIAVAADFPTLNQNTTGSAATLTTSRNIDGQAFNGSADITVIAPGTHAATSKVTPVDADELPLVDSAASNVLKKLTWANLKATLKTYFDSLTTTLTNKRITARVLSEAFSATPTINTDSFDEYHATAMSGAITSMTSNLTGTPVTGDILVCEFTDNGTARAITWGASFESSTVTLPTTTVISALLTVTLKWNAATSKWRCVGAA